MITKNFRTRIIIEKVLFIPRNMIHVIICFQNTKLKEAF